MKIKPLLDGMEPLFPSHFFAYTGEIVYAKEMMQAKIAKGVSSPFQGFEEKKHFVESAFFWNEEGILGLFEVKNPLSDSFFPQYEKGDAIELFIDTRDNKQNKWPTRFCHHFVFLPFAVEGIKHLELTKLRPDDAHDLAAPSLLGLSIEEKKGGYNARIYLPKEALFGYEPDAFKKIGIAYRVHRAKKEPCQFPFSAEHFTPLQNPSLWASFIFTKENT